MINDSITTPLELEDAAMVDVKKFTNELMTKIADMARQIVWQVANDYIHDHLEVDTIVNLQDSIRQEVVRCSHIWCRNKDEWWGKQVRAKLFDEHKEVILPMIYDEQMEAKDKEITALKEDLQDLQKKFNNRMLR